MQTNASTLSLRASLPLAELGVTLACIFALAAMWRVSSEEMVKVYAADALEQSALMLQAEIHRGLDHERLAELAGKSGLSYEVADAAKGRKTDYAISLGIEDSAVCTYFAMETYKKFDSVSIGGDATPSPDKIEKACIRGGVKKIALVGQKIKNSG